MLSGRSNIFPANHRPRRRVNLVLGCALLLAAHPSPPVHAAGQSRFNPQQGERFFGTALNQLRILSEQDRSTSLTQTFSVVPPSAPDLHPGGPLPGYQIVSLSRGHFNRLYLTATVGSTKGLMMVDTGLTNTALSEDGYHSLLLRTSALPAGVPRFLNLNGTRTPVAPARDFYVGGSNLGSMPVNLLPVSYLTDPGSTVEKGRVYDGLLGGNILRQYQAVIDCGRLALYLNFDPARRINLAPGFVRQGWTRVPMIDTGSHFLVPCVINGQRFRLVVDTGSPFTTLDRDLLKQRGIQSRGLPLRGGLLGKKAGQVSLVEVDSLQIGDYHAAEVRLTATGQSFEAFGGRAGNRSADGPVAGLLGGDILGRDNAVIDYGSRSLFLKPPAVPKRERTAKRDQPGRAAG